ncbi:MAG TPA: biotin/lipoyl-binding protein [Propionibacterium sp.]|nr:biotin/lipoyl-binding protein [Propionibacterium sp.]
MSWLNRLQILLGIVVVLVLVAGLTLLFNQRQNQVASLEALVEAPTSAVASAYGGVVVDQLVKPGDQVTAGQDLFVVDSPSLQEAIARGVVPASTPAFTIDATAGTVTYHAVSDGYLTDFVANHGTYINNGGRLASVVADGQKTVRAFFQLNPFDYGRITENAPVRLHLPDGARVTGEVVGVDVRSQEGSTMTVVTVASDSLQQDDYALLTRRGTPVLAVMSLRDDGILAGPAQAVNDFLLKIGLR